MKATTYFLDQPGGEFSAKENEIPTLNAGEILVKTKRTSICKSDVIIYKKGLQRIKQWPAVILHEVCCEVVAVDENVSKFQPGDLLGIGCDLPCGDKDCIYCGENGTGDWTSCPNTHATGHEFPGFARTHAVLPDWFVQLGPIKKFPERIPKNYISQLEPLACCLEGMTRVNNCITDRVVVLIGAGSQSTYALQVAQAMKARKIILVNRGEERLQRVLDDFGDETTVGLLWDNDIEEKIFKECRPFNEPHFIMMNVPHEAGYELATKLMGYNTVLDAHAGVKGPEGKPAIMRNVDLNNDIHYKLQCYQATHGSSMHGINLAYEMLLNDQLPNLHKMTRPDEIFKQNQIKEAILRGDDKDSLKVIIDWD
ncbi:alcohol dehydrogenase catalytic domain-containing protein [Galbibacter mesophilus]|uniref:alcohol dehydrogenase catalytic domain-containing protein n=1 Tax=Galbibacter mesophilus TaxID=379069 RepID=UPI0019202525|nr:alcohol dehydrogenase catalytic domain-containing protein [Galbibacter mesophilus]MCM5663078.1 alcohol dehydrogenase catalytic domain-containing protein [Galbibacter mesophilus]